MREGGNGKGFKKSRTIKILKKKEEGQNGTVDQSRTPAMCPGSSVAVAVAKDEDMMLRAPLQSVTKLLLTQGGRLAPAP